MDDAMKLTMSNMLIGRMTEDAVDVVDIVEITGNVCGLLVRVEQLMCHC